MSYISTVNELESWFREGSQKRGNSTFILYSGFFDKLSGRTPIIRHNDLDIDENDSWDKLNEMINNLSKTRESKFTILLPDKNDRRGISNQTKIWYLNSFNNSPMQNGLYTKEQLEDKLLIHDLGRRLEEIEQGNNISGSTTDALLQKAVESIDFGAVGMAFAGWLQNMNNKNGKSVAGKPVNTFVERIKPHFETEEHAIAFLTNLLDRFEEDPKKFIEINSQK